MPYDTKKPGRWVTVDNGEHVYLGEGQSPKEAFDSLKYDNGVDPVFDSTDSDNGVDKKRTIKKYWVYYDDSKRNGSTVSKRQFENAENEKWWKPRYVKEIKEKELDYSKTGKSKEELESIMSNIINNANDTSSLDRRKIEKTMVNAGINYYSADDVFDAFEDDIIDKHNELVKPLRDRMESISSSNAKEIFKNNVKISSADVKMFVDDSFELCDDEGKQLYAIMASSEKISYLHTSESNDKIGVCFRRSDRAVYLNDSINSKYYKKGEIPMHETAHALDCYYGKPGEYLSISFVGSNRKTLQETLRSETFGKKGKDLFEQAKEDMITHENDFLNKIPGFKENEEKLNKLKKQLFDAANNAHTVKIELDEGENEKPNPSNDWEEYHELNNKNWEMRNQYVADIAWGDVSDVFDGMTHGHSSLTGMGHRVSYWSSDARAHEFFAEYVSSKVCNKESNDLMKKYFPQTCKVAEEMLQHIIKNKGGLYDYYR